MQFRQFQFGKLFLAKSLALPANADILTGKTFVDKLRLSNTIVPLPEGEWQGLINSVIINSRGKDEVVLLAKVENKQLQELIAARLQTVTDGNGFDRFVRIPFQSCHAFR